MYSNWSRIPTDTREEGLKEALWHILYCMQIAEWQAAHNKFYIFEHPTHALSWQMAAVQHVPGEVCEIDQCAFGLVDPDGNPLLKKTKIKTNMPSLVRLLNQPSCRCNGGHTHGLISGQPRGMLVSRYSQVYPEALCEVFAKAVRQELHIAGAL